MTNVVIFSQINQSFLLRDNSMLESSPKNMHRTSEAKISFIQLSLKGSCACRAEKVEIKRNEVRVVWGSEGRRFVHQEFCMNQDSFVFVMKSWLLRIYEYAKIVHVNASEISHSPYVFVHILTYCCIIKHLYFYNVLRLNSKLHYLLTVISLKSY